jgi:hypothetical protein
VSEECDFVFISDISAFKEVSLLQEGNVRGGGKTNSRRRLNSIPET